MEDIEPDLQSLKETMAFDNVTDELKQRLNISKKEGAPILLPPKDYDTISRARGNMNSIDKRKCLNETIVGLNGIQYRSRNRSDESGIDVSSPSEDSEDRDKFHFDQDSPNSSPPLSSRDSARDIYPPQSARLPGTPRSGQDRRIPSRQQSFHSNYSNHSYRSLGGSSSNDESGVIYRGERVTERIEDLPPDYDDDTFVQMRNSGLNWRNSNLNASMPDQRYTRNAYSDNLGKSMPAHILQDEQIYANKKRFPSVIETNSSVYAPQSQVNVRRVHSMNNYK
jgi:hypothetical protein